MDNAIEALIQQLARFPGLGTRSARRVVLHLLEDRERRMVPFIAALSNLEQRVCTCSVCGNIDLTPVCGICSDYKRQDECICIVESVADLWAIERTHCFSGRYHVLGGILSSSETSATKLRLDALKQRCAQNETRELVVALGATIEGKITEHYIKKFFCDTELRITVIAHGIPIGGELEQIDPSTISTAFTDRK